MIIFVNGKIGCLSPACGKPYFTEPQTPFVELAKEFFHDDKIFFTEKDYKVFSTPSERRRDGYKYIKGIHDLMEKHGDDKKLIDIYKDSNGKKYKDKKDKKSIKLIAHSMGCAFADGIADYFIERQYKIEAMIYINAYQSSKITANPNIPLNIDFQYTDDIVMHIPFFSQTSEIKGAISIREKSGLCLRRRHRGPIYPNSKRFWNSVKLHTST